MKLLKKLSAGFCLVIGIPIVVLMGTELLNPALEAEEREESLAALFVLGVPFTAIGSWLLWDSSQQAKKQQEILAQRERERLRQIFYTLLTQQQGRITLLSFAQAANISGEAARAYLDERASEFNADYDVSEAGSVIYHFRI